MLRRVMQGLASGLVALGVVIATPVAAQVKLKAGVSVNFEGMLPIWVANDQGYFKAEGVELELVDFKGGGPAVQAFVGRSIEILFAATDHVLRLQNRGIPAVVLHGLDSYHNYTLISRANIQAKGLADLKGKSVGITSPGSMTDNTIRWAIKEKKLDPDRDFRISGAGVGAAMIAAIDSGKVDAGLVQQTDTAFLLQQKKGDYKVVEDFTSIPYAGYSVLALTSWVDANKNTARGIQRAVARAVSEVEKNPALGTAIIKKLYPHFSDELVVATVRSAIARVPKGGQYSAEAVESVNQIVRGADPKLKPMTPESLRPNL
jgi:NitT/TauT family transport system substrate-binding protein